MKHYTADALVNAYLEAKRWEQAHSDLATYHTARYRAFVSSFGVDPEKSTAAGDVSAMAYLHVFQRAVKLHQQIGSPFDGMLEAPPPVSALYARHADRFDRVNAQSRQALTDFMIDVLAQLSPRLLRATVTSEELQARGFDDTAEAPDPIDYL